MSDNNLADLNNTYSNLNSNLELISSKKQFILGDKNLQNGDIAGTSLHTDKSSGYRPVYTDASGSNMTLSLHKDLDNYISNTGSQSDSSPVAIVYRNGSNDSNPNVSVIDKSGNYKDLVDTTTLNSSINKVISSPPQELTSGQFNQVQTEINNSLTSFGTSSQLNGYVNSILNNSDKINTLENSFLPIISKGDQSLRSDGKFTINYNNGYNFLGGNVVFNTNVNITSELQDTPGNTNKGNVATTDWVDKYYTDKLHLSNNYIESKSRPNFSDNKIISISAQNNPSDKTPVFVDFEGSTYYVLNKYNPYIESGLTIDNQQGSTIVVDQLSNSITSNNSDKTINWSLGTKNLSVFNYGLKVSGNSSFSTPPTVSTTNTDHPGSTSNQLATTTWVDENYAAISQVNALKTSFSNSSLPITISSDGSFNVTAGYNIQLGQNTWSTLIGSNTYSGGQYSVAVGTYAGTGGWCSTAIGSGSSAGSQSTSIGYASGYTASGSQNTISIGFYEGASGNNSISIGTGFGRNGSPAKFNDGNNIVAIGYGARTDIDNVVSLGYNTWAKGQHSVALGGGSVASSDNTISVGWGDNGSQGSVDNINNQQTFPTANSTIQTPQYRRIVNLADGINSHDAVTYAQLQKVSSSFFNANSSEVTIGSGAYTYPGSWSISIGETSSSGAQYNSGAIAIGFGSSAPGTGISIGYNSSTGSGVGIALGRNSIIVNNVQDGVALGHSSVVTEEQTVSVGYGTYNTNESSMGGQYRRIVNMAPGKNATDGCVVSQLPPAPCPMIYPSNSPIPSGYIQGNGQGFSTSGCPQLASAFPSGKVPDLGTTSINGVPHIYIYRQA